MRSLRQYILFILFLLFTVGLVSSIHAQSHRIDSLRKKILASTDKKQKLAAILNICEEKNSYPSDTLAHYADELAALSNELNDKHGKNWAEYYSTFRLLRKGANDSAFQRIIGQLKRLQANGEDEVLQNRLYLMKATSLTRSQKTNESLAVLYELLNRLEKKPDLYIELFAYNHIGSAYEISNHFTEALDWFEKGLRKIPDPTPPSLREIYASLVLNKGITLTDMYQADMKRTDLADSAGLYLRMAVDSSRTYEYIGNLAYSLNMQGLLLSYKKQIAEAEKYYQEGLAIHRLFGDPYYIISDIVNLSNFYLNSRQPQKGIAICLEGIELSHNTKITYDLSLLYSGLAENYKASGDFIKYGETLKQVIAAKDSDYQKNSAEALAELQTRFEVQKKENTIIRQQYDLSRKNYLIYGVSVILLLTILGGFIYFNNRRKNQLLKLRQLELSQKQKTTEAVMQAEETERKRIAADLHDSVAQKMVVASMNLESIHAKITKLGEQEQKIYTAIRDLLDESTAEVRNLSHSMIPRAFTMDGLPAAIKDFLDKLPPGSLKVDFSSSGDFSGIHENTGLMIYRIIQEAVQNVLKHAKATHLDISLILENSELDITLEDNGVGFDTSLLAESESMGMKNIQSRVNYLNGKLEIHSEPGKGSLLAIFIPISKTTL